MNQGALFNVNVLGPEVNISYLQILQYSVAADDYAGFLIYFQWLSVDDQHIAHLK